MKSNRSIVASRDAPPLDHAMLVAAAAVRQAGTRTARLAVQIETPREDRDAIGTLVALFGGRAPADPRALRGSFHPGVADGARGGRSISVKTRFTLAF